LFTARYGLDLSVKFVFNGGAITEGLVAGFSQRRPRFHSGSVRVRFMVKKIALVWVFPEYFRCTLSVSFHQYSILIFIYIFVLPEGEEAEFGKFPKFNAVS